MQSSVSLPSAPRPTSVLVVHGDTFIALNIVRSIGRHGVPVTVLYGASGIAAQSRYCTSKERYSSENEVIPRIRQFVTERGVTHVIATSENLIALLNQHREELEKTCTLLFPPERVFERALNKDQTLTIAERVGVPIPRTVTVQQAADLEECRSLSYPVAVKPQGGEGAGPFKVEYCGSHQELLKTLDEFLDGGQFLVQEYVEGQGVGIEVLMRKGEPLMVFSHVRIRESPPTGGVSTCCKSVEPDPALVKYSVALLRAMEWDGVAMVEFKVNPDTGRIALMEVNGRFWGSLPLAIQAGADFPFELLWTSAATQLSRPYRPRYGVRCRLLVAETKWLWDVWRTGHPNRATALYRYLTAFSPFCRYYCFSFDDLNPPLAAIVARSKKVFGQAMRKFRPIGRPARPDSSR